MFFVVLAMFFMMLMVFLHGLRLRLRHFSGRCGSGGFGIRSVRCRHDSGKGNGGQSGDDGGQDFFMVDSLRLNSVPVVSLRIADAEISTRLTARNQGASPSAAY